MSLSMYLNTDSSSIQVCDSLGGRISKSKKKLIADHFQCKTKSITIYHQNVQKQLGDSDCGCFALAFATSLCNGIEQSKELYDQKAMRIHLLGLLTNQIQAQICIKVATLDNSHTIQRFNHQDFII